MAEIDVMRASLDRRAARRLVDRLLGAGDARVERQVYYPYYRYAVSGQLRWLFGRRRVGTECLVDARTGRAATADAVRAERRRVADEHCLPVARPARDAGRSARRYATHALGRRFRLIANLRLRVSGGALLHRPFWIVRAGRLRVLVDAVSGELHPLAAAAADARPGGVHGGTPA